MLKLADQDSKVAIKIQVFKWKYYCDEWTRSLSRKRGIKTTQMKFLELKI